MPRAKKAPSAKKRAGAKQRSPAKRPTGKRAAPKRTVRKAPPSAARKAKSLAAAPSAGRFQRARIVMVSEAMSSDPSAGTVPDSPEFVHRILAEGDSWFSIGAIPIVTAPGPTNLLRELMFGRPAAILSLADPGDTLRRMSTLVQNERLRRFTANPNFASKWDLVLLSGGGNDLIDSAAAIVKTPVTGGSTDANDYVDLRQLAALLASVQDGYRRIVALRDAEGSSCAGKPLLTHTYDYPTPRPAPVTFAPLKVLGPWLHSTFEDRRTPQAMRGAITKLLIDRLAEALLALTDELADFHVVDTRGTLAQADPAAKGNDADWQNEIHPNLGGYRKLAAVVSPVIRSLLP